MTTIFPITYIMKKIITVYPFYLLFIIYSCCLSITSGTVTGWFKVETPSGEPIQGMILRHYPYNTADFQGDVFFVTDQEGKANVTGFIPMQNFVIEGIMSPYETTNSLSSKYQKLYIYGRSSSIDFYYTTYLGTRAQAILTANLIGIPYNSSNGYVVVGMDIMEDPHLGLVPSNLEPAVGATSTLSGLRHGGEPFIFAPRIETGSTVQPHGSSFVTYPDVVPGNGNVSVTYNPPSFSCGPICQCGVSPGFTESLGETLPVEVFPDSISVVSYVCIKILNAASIL